MIRKIELNVDKNGKISAPESSFAGVCGETGVSEVCFIVCDDLLNAINTATAGKTIYYRFEVTDALNRHYVLENTAIDGAKRFSLAITNAFTECDGMLSVALVFESDGLTLCTLPVELKIEKDCGGIPNSLNVRDTIVTIFDSAEKNVNTMLNTATQNCENAKSIAEDITKNAKQECVDMLSLSDQIINNAKNECAEIQSTAEKILSDTKEECKEIMGTTDSILNNAQQNAKAINESALDTANGIVETMNTSADKKIERMNELLSQSKEVQEECEQRKTAAETAAVNAINAANDAANSKTQTEEMLSTKEDLSNKETNLMQDPLPDHTKYASARATQDLVSALAKSFGEQIYDAHARIEDTKADKTALEETNVLLAKTQQELAEAQQELAEANAQIEKLKTAEDFQFIGEIICDGKSTTFYLRNIEPLKRIYVQVSSPTAFETTLGDFSCYANTFNSADTAFVYTKATAGTKFLRFYSERIYKGNWKTDLQYFSVYPYNNTWNTSYTANSIDYITALKFSCGDGTTTFFPENTKIKVYGVKA